MHLFSDYIQPLTFWLYANPQWALLIAFIMAFAESLAIVGSIVPGSVTMTAIGILAGSEVMNIGWTTITVVAGAVAGDGASYALGYIFSDHLSDMWPFRRYPRWLEYGKDYFARHGGKSVLLGRFFGPLRSIIPVIAGILHMNPWHFLLANIVSAIGWAIMYLLPGILIGAASTELSAESATRLFIFILLILVASWLISQGMRFIYLHTNQFLHRQLQKIWSLSKHHKKLAQWLATITPHYEKYHYHTISAILLFLVCLLSTIVLIALVIQGQWIMAFNESCQLFLQSIRTQSFDVFFIIISLIISPVALISFAIAIGLCAIHYRAWRMLRYWLSLIITSIAITWLITVFIEIPKPTELLHSHTTPKFPEIHLTLAATLFGFLIGYVNSYRKTATVLLLRIILSSLLFLFGLAELYLGDNWASSILASYSLGLTICLAHWIYYRRLFKRNKRPLLSSVPVILICSVLVLSTGLAYPVYFEKRVHQYTPYVQQFVLTHQIWWKQKNLLLPAYSLNRIGNPIGLLNVQYLGSLNDLKQVMIDHGWKEQKRALLYSLLMRISGQNSSKEVPLMAQLYLNKKPTLVMTYTTPDGEIQYSLRLWRSNYHLRHYRQPLWLGSLVCIQKSHTTGCNSAIFNPLLSGLNKYKTRMVNMGNTFQKQLPSSKAPSTLLLIES